MAETGDRVAGKPPAWRGGVRIACLLAALAAAPRAMAQGPGVACDGVRDATAALTGAVAAGGTVRIGPGLCLLSAGLIVPSNTTLVGAGIGRTVLRATMGDAFNVIEIGNGPGRQTGSHAVDVSGLTVDGGAQRGDTIGHHSDGILVRSASSGVMLHDLEVMNAGDNGIDVIGSHVDVTDSLVHDNFHNGIYVKGIGKPGGLHVARASFVRILRNTVRHNSRAKAPGAHQRGEGHAWDGIDVDPVSANVLIQGNTVDGNDIILLEHGQVVPWSGPFQVIDNLVENSNQSGIDVAGRIDGFQLTGNRIRNVSVFGIIVGGEAANGVIRGNVIQDTSGQGIMVRTAPGASASQNIVIEDNTVQPGPRAAGAAAIAVRHTPGVRVVGNQVGGAAGLDLRDAGPGLVAQDNH